MTGNLITIAAPSDNIPSTYKDGGYAIGSGTSSSTAIVAGAAALVRSRFPSLTAGEVVNRLTATAIDKGPPGRDDEYGYGLINLVGALTAKVPPAGSTTCVTLGSFAHIDGADRAAQSHSNGHNPTIAQQQHPCRLDCRRRNCAASGHCSMDPGAAAASWIATRSREVGRITRWRPAHTVLGAGQT